MLESLSGDGPDSGSRSRRRRWRSRVSGALDETAAAARAARMQGLADLCRKVGGYLVHPDSAGLRARTMEPWIAALVGLCAGSSDRAAVAVLTAEPTRWPRFGTARCRSLTELAPRLAREAEHLLPGFDGEPARLSAAELALMAESARALDEELKVLARDDPRQAIARLAEQLPGFAQACQHVGLRVLEPLFRALARQLTGRLADDGPDALPVDALEWAGLWQRWFEAPEPAALERALALHARFGDADPASPDAAQLEAARSTLRVPEVLDTAPQRDPSPDDDAEEVDPWSLAIADDADPEVIEELRNELPAAMRGLEQAVASVVEGDDGRLDEARRIAHTIKGAANTVGIRGIAAVAHWLEDLLEARAVTIPDGVDPAGDGDPPRHHLLADGCDALAEMIEALDSGAALSDLSRDAVGRLARSRGVRIPPAPVPARESEPGAGGAAGGSVGAIEGDGSTPAGGPTPAGGSARAGGTVETDQTGRATEADGTTEVGGTTEAGGATETGGATERGDASFPAAGHPAGATDHGRPGQRERAPRPGPEPGATSADQSVPPPVPSAAARPVPPAQPADALDKANEGLAVLALAQEVLAALRGLRRSLRGSDERLQTLAAELDRLAEPDGPDARPTESAFPAPSGSFPPSVAGIATGTDPPEPERFDPLDFERRGSLPSVARRIAEAAADNRQIDQAIAERLEQLGAHMERLERLHNGLRESALRARMVPADRLAARLQRVCRQGGRLAGRDASLLIEGGRTLVDADTLHQLAEPLAHLIRNAIAHGIEPAGTRIARGKPPQGRILIHFASATGWLSVSVEDDGAGLDVPAIAERARALGLLGEGLSLDGRAAEQLVLAPGFSTTGQATQISGRGMGLDVVHQAVRALRGNLQVRSRPGRGLTIQIELPLEMMLRPLFVLRSASHVVALSTRGVRAIEPDVESVQWDGGRGRYPSGGRTIEVLTLESALGLPDGLLRPGADAVPMLLRVEVPGGRECGLVVGDPGPARPALVRELPAYMPRLPGIDGAAILGDGAIAPVLDLPELISTAAAVVPDARPMPEPAAPVPVCLVVDDSVSVRRATAQFLTDLGFETETADNGRHALERLRGRRPDLLIVDLEMPEMDGMALTRAVRSTPGLEHLPVIMITSRASSRVRDLALAAGASHFLAKPFSEDELAALVVGILR